MSSLAEKLKANLAEAVAILERLTQKFEIEKRELIQKFELEKRALETEKDEQIEALERQLEAEKAKLRATRPAFQASAVARHMIVAMDLDITWSDTPQYWQWTIVPESSDAVAKLLNVCWLQITGRLDASKLTPNTTYAAYLVYKLTEKRLWFDIPPGEAYAGPVVGENSVSKVCLVPKEDQVGSERADRYPKQRPDGWMEVELGEFLINEQPEEDGGEIEMRFQEVGGNWKRGLIVRGMEVRPKHE